VQERPLLVRAARLFTPRATGDDSLVLSGERISAVGPFAEMERAAGAGAELLDLRPLSLVPGFVDTHVHISGSGARTAVEDRRAETVDVMLLRCAGNGARTLTEGVTTVRDCGARNDVIFPYRDAAQRGILGAPRTLASGSPLTRTAGHGDMWGGEADSVDQITTLIRRQSRLGADCLKVMVDMGLDGSRRARPGLLMFGADELGQIVREAADWGLPVIAHCLTLGGIRAATAAGVHSIEHAIFFDAERDEHAYDPALVDEIARKSIWVNPGQTFAYEAIATASPSERFARNAALFERRLEDDAKMLAAGVRLVSGTDAGTYATPFGRFALAPILFATRIGMTPLDALAASTSSAAEAIGLAGQVGELRAGLAADVVAVDGDPESDVHALERVRVVIARGHLVRDNRPATAMADQH
jgi:imidazolonepropionase-like amidohydrolase